MNLHLRRKTRKGYAGFVGEIPGRQTPRSQFGKGRLLYGNQPDFVIFKTGWISGTVVIFINLPPFFQVI